MIETPPIPTASAPLPFSGKEDVTSLVARINNEYLYWSDVKYRAAQVGLTPEELWSCVKSARRQTDVGVRSLDNIHFSLTNSMQRMCHEFDMNFGGSWGASKISPTTK